MSVILPTHHCFDDALDFISERMKADPKTAWHLVLVHGVCLIPDGPRVGEPFSHAWVEDGDLVWQGGLLNGELIAYSAKKVDFERDLRPQDLTRYSVREAAMENQRTGHYGPWVDRYRVHLRKATVAA